MSERELIDTGTDKRYVRRDKEGQFKQSVDALCPLTSARARGMTRGGTRATRAIRSTRP